MIDSITLTHPPYALYCIFAYRYAQGNGEAAGAAAAAGAGESTALRG
jgi:hypothetical protein